MVATVTDRRFATLGEAKEFASLAIRSGLLAALRA